MLFRTAWALFLLSWFGLGLAACAASGGAVQQNSPSPAQAFPSATRSPNATATAGSTRTASTTALPSRTALLVATITASPTRTTAPSTSVTSTPLACWRRGGRVETGVLRTDLLRLPMDYRVYLPPCYRQQVERRYPVLFLIHGQSFNDDQWDRLGVDETMDRLVAAGEIAPFIIVMPRDRYAGQPSENNFARVIVEQLMPHVDRTYRTLPDRAHRAVGGLSRGGGWAVHLAMVYWQSFGALGAHSPAIFYDDAQRMRVYLDTIPEEDYPRIYIDVGDKDRLEIMDAAIWFEKLLNDWDVPHEWYLFSGYHEEAYWEAHVEGYLRWYAADW